MNEKYRKTVYACFVAYVVQAIVNNFVPLLFLTFQSTYGIPLSKITLLITINFTLQLCIDFASVKLIDVIGYRKASIIAHICSAIGIASLVVLPELFADPFIGLLLSVVIYAVGGGLLEVIVTPIVQASAGEQCEKLTSLLHSFYCWGHVGVVLLSTLFFRVFGIENWKYLALAWALVPLLNSFVFIKAPIAPIIPEGEKSLKVGELFKNKLFWVFFIMMACAGACEQAVSQWASTFAEKGLGVTKTVGDLAGPMMFAVLMGASRAFYGKFGDKINLDRFIMISVLLCGVSYLVIALAPIPWLSLVGCGLTGLSVGILWPGTFSRGTAKIKNGGTAMFAFFALAGDLGCMSGPTFVGFVSSAAGDDLKIGVLFALIFPILMLAGTAASQRMTKKTKPQEAK